MNTDDNATGQPKPILIFDGDCTFCRYWVDYWEKITRSQVEYKPYQDVAANYPSIPLDAFKEAVQYVTPNGQVASGAEASFLTLSHAPGKGGWLWVYRHVPGFAFIAEKSYTFISTHRSFFYSVSRLLWGNPLEPASYNLVSWLFLRGLGLLFFFAFFSFGLQALGLIGSQGIIPVANLVNAAGSQLGLERYWLLPMVFWLNASDLMIQLTCWCGAILALLLVFNIYPRLCLLLMYVLYLSLIVAGQTFMTFQWDLFLLEAGVIAIFLVSYTTAGIWLLRWLLFRFILAAGLVKLLSGDNNWWNCSALSYHFFTQPLPTPIAWYAQQLPTDLLCTVAFLVLFIELVLPFFIFLPRRLRFIAAYGILCMQIGITVTGNYNFFNLQTMLLCLVLFDDAALRHLLPASFSRFIARKSPTAVPGKFLGYLTYIFAVFTIFFSIIQFQLRFTGHTFAPALWIQQQVSPLQLVNTYGPFAVMTTNRMEIIIEGSDDEIHWREYEFKYKPGDVYQRPPWNIPHQPRLDWQMWFAALSAPRNNPWFYSFLQRLLENSPTVTALLKTNPFPDQPPKYVRALFYEYQFTTPKEKSKTGAWWTRKLIQFYLPSIHLQEH